MRAMILAGSGGLERLQLAERPDPGRPGAGEIRVRVHATSLNYHDYAVAAGRMPTADGRVPMADGAGIVEAVGDGVTDFREGDAVVSCFFPQWQDGPPIFGSFAQTPGDGVDGFAQEVVVRPAAAFTRAPAGWSHAEAATITTAGLTAWRALVVDGGLTAGDIVLALGTGGVSIYALQIAKMFGATAIVTSSSDQKLERARALGADHLLNYRTTPDWGKAVTELTGGKGATHIVEVGGPGTLPQSVAAVAPGGHIALIGVLTGAEGVVPTAFLMVKQARIQGLVVGSRSQQQAMVEALDGGGFRPVIDRSFALKDLADAFAHEESGTHFGKIVVEW